MASEKPIHSLVVDTGPLIKNTISISTMIQSAEQIYTTPAILSEIKDTVTRSRVETTLIPFLKLKNPTPASYEFVAQFSKRTGDFPVLSRQDLGILALAYEIDQERKKEEEKASAECQTNGEQKRVGIEEQTPENANGEATGEVEVVVLQEESHGLEMPKEPVAVPADDAKPTELLEEGISSLQIASSDEDDDDGEWITPSNLQRHRAKDSGISLRETQAKQLSCATMTTDYAMQNVLLQLQLSLLSPSLQRIKNLRTYILRCHACFLTTKEMTKQFCPRCGQPTLNRVPCSTNAKGEFKIHLAKSHQWNNRGNRYSIPKPVEGSANMKGGKGGGKGGWGKDLVLAEDQKEYMRGIAEEKRRKTRDLMDDDYLPSILTGDRGRAGGRPKVGAGRNVNSRKRF